MRRLGGVALGVGALCACAFACGNVTVGVSSRGNDDAASGASGASAADGAAGATGAGGSSSRGGSSGGGFAGTTGTAGAIGADGGAGSAAGAGGAVGSSGTAGTGGGAGAGGTGGGGGGGGSTSHDAGVDAPVDAPESCDDLKAEYVDALRSAKNCNLLSQLIQCTETAPTDLACPTCLTRVETTTHLDDLRARWTNAGCKSGICPNVACAAPGAGSCVGIGGGAATCMDQSAVSAAAP